MEDDDQEMDEDEESEMVSGEKEFEDVFDDIGDSPEYPKKKNKSIKKGGRQEKFKPKANPKRQSYKNKKKEFKSGGKKNFSNKKRR